MEKVIEFMHRFLEDESEFTDEELDLYKIALTHSTYGSQGNQRLAFLGDAVLKQIIREHLYLKNPYDCKGILTMASSRIESNNNYSKIAINLNVFNYMRVGNPALKSHNITANAEALEALFGAVYLTKGLQTAKRLAEKYILNNNL
ncbi:ribonuclease III domain-containing protein [Methanolobus halotolerans]|nr:ribonuclease III domain-containing protein [Methanolobus halotolerans]